MLRAAGTALAALLAALGLWLAATTPAFDAAGAGGVATWGVEDVLALAALRAAVARGADAAELSDLETEAVTRLVHPPLPGTTGGAVDGADADADDGADDGAGLNVDWSVERALFSTAEAVGRMRASVQCGTVSHVWEDTEASHGDCWEWAQFRALRAHWESAYPHAMGVVAASLPEEKRVGLPMREEIPPLPEGTRATEGINRTVFVRWAGSAGDDEALPPVVLMAHSDVVPIEDGTEEQWVHPPFSGHLDERGYIWGRGTIDDKPSAAAVLESVEALAASGWRPRRTLYIVIGHDEEVSGVGGARHIAEILAQRHPGPTGLGLVVDEGGSITAGILSAVTQRPVALIGIGEKGYLSLELTVRDAALSGHSSMPPRETAIGVLTRAVAAVEQNPPPLGLPPAAAATFRALSKYVPGVIQRVIMSHADFFKPILERVLDRGANAERALVRTTTAPTILEAGNKENVLPQAAMAVINFRIKSGESIAGIREHVTSVINDPRVELEERSFRKEPSPSSRTDGAAWEALRMVTQEACPTCAVAPYTTPGGTDSRYFHKSCEHVYRFLPVRMAPHDVSRFHGTNERIHVNDLETSIAAWIRLIRRTTGTDVMQTNDDDIDQHQQKIHQDQHQDL